MTLRDQAFIYAYLIYGQQREEIFSVLPQARVAMFKKEIRKFEKFPREVRLNMVLKLFGYLYQHVRQRNLEMIHPSWMAELLRKENPRVLRGVLDRFSPEYRQRLMDCMELSALPKPDPVKFEEPESMQLIFDVFCSCFVPMTAPWGSPELSVETIYLLKEDDLLALVQQTGIREITRAVAPAGKNAIAAAASRFPAHLQEDFLAGIKKARSEDPVKHKMAAKRLLEYSTVSSEEATMNLGLTKLAGILKGKPDLLKKVGQRLPRPMGLILIEKAVRAEALPEEAAEILEIIRDLIGKGKIDKSYVETRFASLDPDARSRRTKRSILE